MKHTCISATTPGAFLKDKELDWKALYGLGKGLWKEDAQEYVNRLRENWHLP